MSRASNSNFVPVPEKLSGPTLLIYVNVMMPVAVAADALGRRGILMFEGVKSLPSAYGHLELWDGENVVNPTGGESRRGTGTDSLYTLISVLLVH